MRKYLFNYAVFSNEYTFNNYTDFTMDLFFNLWDEFCHPQCRKSYQLVQTTVTEFELKNKQTISFTQQWNGASHLALDRLCEQLFCYCAEFTDDEKQSLNKQLKTALEPYQRKLYQKAPEKIRNYISIKNVPNVESISNIIYHLENLLAILTKDFSADIEKIRIRIPVEGRSHPCMFYFLYRNTHPQKKCRYENKLDPLTCHIFSDDEWKTIFENLLNKKCYIQDVIYYTLNEANYSKSLSFFHLTSYLDCIVAISEVKKYKQKYQDPLNNYIADLDDITRQELLAVFEKSLRNVDAGKKVLISKAGNLSAQSFQNFVQKSFIVQVRTIPI